jgi:SsrA-binding protein
MEIKNRQATHEFFIEERYAAGMVLLGTEVKSLKEGKGVFNDSYCIVHKGEIWLKSFHIAEYAFGNIQNHEPLRDRKLLLQKKEIRKISNKLKEKGFTLVPLRIFTNEKNLLKIEIGLARGKKQHDKRESIRQKDMERQLRRQL